MMDFLKKVDAWVLSFVPPIVTNGIKDYPGFTIAAAVVLSLFGNSIIGYIVSKLV
jgi:hypothetical protein